MHKVGYIVLHEQNIIYLLSQVERTDKDQSDRNTAVPAAGQAGQHDEHKYNAGGTQQGGGGEQHALQNARHKRSHEDTAQQGAAAVALLQRGRDDKEKQQVAYKVVPACMAQHMTKQPDKKQRIRQRRTIDAEKRIGRPPIGQVTQLLT